MTRLQCLYSHDAYMQTENKMDWPGRHWQGVEPRMIDWLLFLLPRHHAYNMQAFCQFKVTKEDSWRPLITSHVLCTPFSGLLPLLLCYFLLSYVCLLLSYRTLLGNFYTSYKLCHSLSFLWWIFCFVKLSTWQLVIISLIKFYSYFQLFSYYFCIYPFSINYLSIIFLLLGTYLPVNLTFFRLFAAATGSK